jgi:hypothetical protein
VVEFKIVENTIAMIECAYKNSKERLSKHNILLGIADNLDMMVRSEKEITRSSVKDDNPWRVAIIKIIDNSR